MIKRSMLILLLLSFIGTQSGTASDKEWIIHSIEDFNFFYKGDKAAFVNELRFEFKKELYKLQNKLNYHLNGKVDILLVDKHIEEEQLSSPYVVKDNNLGGTLIDKIDKLVINVYDPPSEIMSKYRKQLVLLILQEMIYGGTFQDRVRTANMFYLPSWVIPGITTYLGEQWSLETDNKWRLIYEKYGVENFNAIPDAYDAEKGASFWKFLNDKYGDNAITTVLYMTRLTRKFNAALYYSFQKTAFELFKDWRDFYHNAYLYDQQKRLPINGIELRQEEVWEIFAESEAKYYLLTEGNEGYRLMEYKGKDQKVVLHLKPDERPLARFSGSVQKIGNQVYCFVSGSEGYGVYSVNGRRVRYYKLDVKSIHRIYIHNDELFLLSSSVMGSRFCKVVIPANLTGVSSAICENIYQYPRGYLAEIAQVNAGFALYTENLDGSNCLVLDSGFGSADTLKKFESRIRQLISLNDSLLHYNCNKNGVYNGMVYNLNQRKVLYLTDYRSDILFHQINNKVLAEFVANLDRSSLFITEPIPYNEYFIYDSLQPTYLLQTRPKPKDLVITDEYVIAKDSLPEYHFLSPVSPYYDFTVSDYDSLKKLADYLHAQDARITRSPELYRPKLFYFQFFNELNVTKDIPFAQALSEYTPNHIGVRFGAGFENQFNNKQLELSYYGFRVWPNRDFVMSYANQTSIPYSFTLLHRQRISFENRKSFYKNGTNYAEFRWSILRRVSWTLDHKLTYRYNFRKLLATDAESLLAGDVSKQFLESGLIFSYKLDDVKRSKPRPALLQLNIELAPIYNLLNRGYGFTSTVNAEYTKTIRPWLKADARFSAGNSIGTGPVYFVLGGVSSDMLADLQQRRFSDAKTASLYRMVYGVRGFPVNFRNGNSYGLINLEMKFKVIELLYERPIVSELLDHLQFVLFTDMAGTLYGRSIYDPANALNSTTFNSPGSTLTIEVRNIRNPFISSYGFGIHTKIYSYVLRADLAYGFEAFEYYGSRLHLSLGYSF